MIIVGFYFDFIALISNLLISSHTVSQHVGTKTLKKFSVHVLQDIVTKT